MRLFGRFFSFVSIIAAIIVIFGMADSYSAAAQHEPIVYLVMRSAWLAVVFPVMVIAWLLGLVLDRG